MGYPIAGFLLCVLFVLHSLQLVEETAQRHQLIKGAHLSHPTLIHYNDAVCIANGGKPVDNGKGGSALGYAVDEHSAFAYSLDTTAIK